MVEAPRRVESEECMNILLVDTNTHRFLHPLPVGLTYVSASLKQAGHRVAFFGCVFSKNPPDELRSMIRSFRPAVVGFSVRNLDAYSRTKPESFLPPIRELVSVAKSENVVSVLGGTAFSTLPEPMLRYVGADYGIAGQGETSMVSLVESVGKDDLDTSISGLAWREGEEIHANSPSIVGYEGRKSDWDLVDLKKYGKKMFATGVVATSGCPFLCNYCDSGAVFGRTPCSRDVQEIVADLKYLVSRGVREFFIVDPCFNTHVAFAKQVLEAIIRDSLKVTFCAEMVPAAGSFDDEFFRLYKRAGGILLLMGGDSLSDKMLQSYKKPCTFDDIYRCTNLAGKHGVAFAQSLLFGGPGENEETLKESLGRISEIPYAIPAAEFGIRIAPNTEVFEIAKREQLVADETELLFPKYYVSKELDSMQAEKAIREELRKHVLRGLKMLPVGFKSFVSRQFPA
jgi:radical SAM superfamily enzyme YgiQ (UPF0313 family)